MRFPTVWRAEPKLVSGGKLATDAANGKERFDVTFSTEGIVNTFWLRGRIAELRRPGDLLAKKGASRNPLTLAC
jgi:hypothetical protein